MIIIARMVIAPTERSMPAVRMISVWPMPSAATMAVCWMRMETPPGCANLGLRIEKAANVMMNRISGLSHG
jgi:hypothetical protein